MCVQPRLIRLLKIVRDREDIEFNITTVTHTLNAIKHCDILRAQRPQKEQVRDGLAYALSKYDKVCDII